MGTLMRPTTKLHWSPGGTGYSQFKGLSRSPGGGAYADAKLIYYGPIGGPYVLKYSTPTATLSGGGANAASGASTGGRAQVNVTANPGGNSSGSFSYSWGGGASLSYLNVTSQTITAYYDFSGVPNGTTSGSVSDTGLFCDVTDTVTGASYRTSVITAGPLTWTNTIPAYTAVSISGPTGVTGNGQLGLAPGTCFASVTDTVTAANGTGSYTYFWQLISSSSGFSTSGQGTASFNCSRSVFLPNGYSQVSLSETWRCTVSDGITSAFMDVQFFLNFMALNGP